MRFQTIALSTAVALSIVAGGIALRLKVANQVTSNTQTRSEPKASPQSRRSNPNAINSTAADSPQKKSPIADSAAKSESDLNSQLSAISVAPIPPATADATPPVELTGSFNHLPYEEADPARLQPAGTFVRGDFERTELLDFEAANAFIIMVDQAKAQGINLIPISGFRSVTEQQELFVKQTERYGSKSAAAKLSAPPEHSEHHTGYAMDIGDGDRPETDLDAQFADTVAYQWLLNNAYIFGFEQSFPQDNPQGLSFEPWHWRYVQSERAMQVFANAKPNESPQP